MRALDVLAFAASALTEGRNRLRTALIVGAMAIGVGGVVTLTWLGEAARGYVVAEFRSLGTELVIMLPGRSETAGGAPPMFGETPRDITLEDALALRRIPEVRRVAPIVVGTAMVDVGRLSREATVIGTTPEYFTVRGLELAAGRVWRGEPDQAQSVCVIGRKIRDELIPPGVRALGSWVRLGDRRFRVIGIGASEGRSIGMDLDELVLVPVASAQALFDSPGMFRVLAEARDRSLVPQTQDAIRAVIRARHDGEDDVTLITQEAVLGTFDDILRMLTYAVAGIAAISLLVAGVLIMNVMIVAVAQRREEIGLLQALGAPPRRIGRLFLVEACMLSLVGAGAGVVLGEVASRIGHAFVPDLAPGAPWWSVVAAGAIALGCGVVFGVAPARRAASLHPVEALSHRG
jgi:putative ABC transport system permease protein